MMASNKNKSSEVILENIRTSIAENLSKIILQFEKEYDFPELDPLRNEISLSIACGLFQAAITLTNHLLENALKTFLIYYDVLTIYASDNKSFYDKIGCGIDKYDELVLSQTIKKTFEKNLIDTSEKEQLNIFREDFRNAYSHATKKKIFKNNSTEISEVELKNGKLETTDKVELIINLLPYQGMIQCDYAENTCVEYFKYVDGLIRKLLVKLDSLKQSKQIGT